jgi:glycosyltransferase involved in cell wall biosynthesis
MSHDLSIAVVAACPFPYPRGTPIRIHRLSQSLAQKGANVHVMSYHLGRTVPDASYRLTRIPNISTYKRLDPGPSYQKLILVDSMLTLQLRRLLKRERFDLIHAHHYEGLIAALLAGSDVPIVYDAHTMLGSELPYYRLGLCQNLKQRIGQYLDRWLPRKADHVVAVTDRIRQQLIRDSRVVADQVDVIQNGVNMEPFADIDASANRSGKRIVFAGNLASYQGIELLLEAFREVLEVISNARLLIVSSSSFTKYEQLAADLKIRSQIDIIDAEFSALPKLLSECDVAVSPRVQCDGVPQKVLNYMAAGLPTVAFCGSAPTLKHNNTGWLVESGNAAAFAQGICNLLSDSTLSQRIGRDAQRLVEAEYSWESRADKTLSVYERVLERATGDS